MKLRQNGNVTVVTVPKTTLDYLGWANTEKVVVEGDKKKDIIIVKRIKEKEKTENE